ncbi:unnamed protein product, partial [Adineta steineri]
MGVMEEYHHKHEKDKLTEPAVSICQAFDEDSEGILFYDTIFVRFENFDNTNDNQENKLFSNDVDFIIGGVVHSLTIPELFKKFPGRIDSYLYIYRRIEEYSQIIKQPRLLWKTGNKIQSLKDKLFDSLEKIFVEHRGLQPNLSIENKDQLTKINVAEHLRSIAKVDKQTVKLLFALSKLSFQSSVLLGDHLKWKNIISNIQYCCISLEEFISCYVGYELAFRDFPFDVLACIEYIEKFPISKQSIESPFIILVQICNNLKYSKEYFFERYCPLFAKGIKQKSYSPANILKFFQLICRHDHLFKLYFSTYAANVDLDALWNMFISICEKSELNDISQKHLTSRLSERSMNASIAIFLHYTNLSKHYLVTQINKEYCTRFLQMYEKIFEMFINHQLNSDQYSHLFSELCLKEFLANSLELSRTKDLHRPSCLLILRRLLFQTHNRSAEKVENIKIVFRNINNFDQGLCEKNDPASIIQDEWLEDLLLRIADDFIYNINSITYQSLCELHHENRWTIYIWNRIIHLSLLKLRTENINETLYKLNEWMKVVQHDVYKSFDTLTILLVMNLFEMLIVKYIKSVLSLSNIEIILNFVQNIRQEQMYPIDAKQVDEFMINGQLSIQKILFLQGFCLFFTKLSFSKTLFFFISESCSTYRDLLNSKTVFVFLANTDIKEIFTKINLQTYKFPSISPKIESLVPHIPKEINITPSDPKERYFQQFIQQVNEWLQWFDKFLTISLHIIEWFKNLNVNDATQLLREIYNVKENSSTTVLQMRSTVERILKLLRPFNDLQRLCHLFNCLTSFHIIDSGGLNNQMDSSNYIRELKRLQPNNYFTVPVKISMPNSFSIHDRQHVQWSIASDKYPCNVQIEYQSIEVQGDTGQLYEKKDVPIEKYVLQGEFETERAGQLIITINNDKLHNLRSIWYRIIQTPLSTCHLFNGIFNMYYQSYHGQSTELIKETEISQLLDKVFQFIDSVLDGSVILRDMTDLKTVFCDKNIRIREEVKKLFTNRSSDNRTNRQRPTTTITTTIITNPPTDKEIEQVCEWLQIYQYYSHINIILSCTEKFDILPIDNDDELIDHLKRLRDENCSLKEITQAYNILKEQFQNLSSQHLQLIKIASECSTIIEIMKKSDLYSLHGRRRFQELRDNLTTQFQLQERNNMILNSWIIAYALCEPFALKTRNFDEFVQRIAGLSNFEEHSVKHIQIVNENAQIIKMWLSAEETTVLDNALITMEHLYRTGTVKIRLRRLLNEESFFQIGYSIKKIPNETIEDDNDNDEQKTELLKFILTKSDIDDHKRQLTFCNVDLQENMFYKKILLNEQLKLLQIVENIFNILCKLETAGHPEYQLREEDYEIHDRTNEIDRILLDLRNEHHIREDRLKRAVKTRTDNLELIYRTLETSYDMWIHNLERYRHDYHLLKLFSNRQIMILIILLTKSTTQNQVKCHFLEKLCLSKDILNHRNKELELTIQCLIHYLHSLSMNDCDLSEMNIIHQYETYQIEPNSSAEIGLKKLSQFLGEVFNNGRELFKSNLTINESQQYLVTVSSTKSHLSDKISLDHDLNLETCCILLNLFQDRLPSIYQILWCSISNEDDIRLFFLRIRTFPSLIFVIMDI